MKAKKVLMLIISIVLLVILLVACNENDTPPIHQHTIVIDDAVAATCANTGLTAGAHCSECGEVVVKQEIISKLDHTVVIDESVESTCSSAGLTSGAHCSNCGEILVVQNEVSPKTHTYDDKYDAFCNVCGYERDAECAHTNLETIVGKPATCTEDGITDGKQCVQCGEIIVAQTVINKLSHNEVIDVAVSPTCTKTGLTEGSHCSACGIIIVAQQEIPIIVHTYDDKYDESCNVCGFIRDAECAHRETEVIKGYEATCTTAGFTDGTKCKKCGELLLEQEVISAKGHTEVIDISVAPTCKETGLTEGSHCSVCGEILLAQSVIDMVEHKFNDADGNCQYCGVNSDILAELSIVKGDIQFLKETSQELEALFDGIIDFISEH